MSHAEGAEARRRRWSVPLPWRITISVLLLTGLIASVGLDALAQTLEGLNWIWFAGSTVVLTASVAVGAANVVLLTRTILTDVSLQRAAKAYLRSWALGMVAPGKVGDLTYAHFLSDRQRTWGPGLAVVVVDKVVTYIVTAIVAVCGLALFVSTSDAVLSGLFALAAVAGLLFILLSDRVRRALRERVLARYADRFTGFGDGVRTLLVGNRPVLAANVALTIARIATASIAIQMMFLAVGVDVSFFDVVMVTLISQLVATIPISFGGLGVRQGVSVALYARVSGIPAAPVLSVGLLETAVVYLGVVIVFATLGVERQR